MSPQPPKYRKLKGRAPGVANVSQLWVADDHLLSVTSVMGFEEYRRFFFRDIEALIAIPTPRRLIWSIFLAFGFAVVLSGGYALWLMMNLERTKMATIIGTAVVAIPFLVGLIANILLGPGCSFWVQLGGRLEPLEAPVRLKAARKIIETVSPEIARAQGQSAAAVS